MIQSTTPSINALMLAAVREAGMPAGCQNHEMATLAEKPIESCLKDAMSHLEIFASCVQEPLLRLIGSSPDCS
jgi:hypothetical protein|tara:strand:+ start:871 stop:1089 length:219 start_codon:yes stop_codon:yes gene_type:complete